MNSNEGCFQLTPVGWVRVQPEIISSGRKSVPAPVTLAVYVTAHEVSVRLKPMPDNLIRIPGVPMPGVACTAAPLTIVMVPVAFSFLQMPVAFML